MIALGFNHKNLSVFKHYHQIAWKLRGFENEAVKEWFDSRPTESKRRLCLDYVFPKFSFYMVHFHFAYYLLRSIQKALVFLTVHRFPIQRILMHGCIYHTVHRVIEILDKVVEGLNHAGFSKKDYRVKDMDDISYTAEEQTIQMNIVNTLPNICSTSTAEFLFATVANIYANGQSHPSFNALTMIYHIQQKSKQFK